MNKLSIVVSLVLFAGILTGCTAQQEVETEETVTEEPSFDELVAVIHPTEGNELEGVVTFSRTDEGIRVVADVEGLGGMGRHGFHIHQYGDCTAPDGTSAGGHFSPREMPHGAPTADERHVGDLGNLTSNEEGEADLDFVDPVLSFDGENSILGRGVIIHAGEDDFESQPTGDAGSRLGCGVIGVAQTE